MSPGPAPADSTDVFAGGGELGRDLRAVDWSATPLGAPDRWPRSLATIVRMMLASRFAMWMAWGPELTFFCNDAYRRDTLGKKYPWALGRPASEVWAEIWPEIGPRIETVMSTGEATWDEALQLFLERSGYPEETYHTFSYSPLADDLGRITGMLCVVSEDTDRVIGERRMATLRDLGAVPSSGLDEQTFLEAASVQLAGNPSSLPFTVIYLFGEDGRAHLAGASGILPGDPVAPRYIAAGAREPWPTVLAASGRASVVDRLPERFTSVPTGPWELPPEQAIVVPLAQPGHERPYGFFVVGANRYRPVDADYRAFVELIAQRLAAGITAARSYEAERRRAEQLVELDRAKTAFFSNVSHEFRTPLTLMLGPLEDALAGSGTLDPGQLELVHRNALRLLKLVGALLDFSRAEAGRMRAEFRPVDLGAVTAELAGSFRDATSRAGIELSVIVDELPGPVFLDRDLWERIILNLVSNAFKVTLEGGITVRVATVDGAAEVSVSDTGPGIPPEELGRLFQRFHRLRSTQARSFEGAGIGLALVRELTELHGGEVSVTSVVGEGSTFTVRLPFGAEHLPAEQVRHEAPGSTATVAPLFVEEALSWVGGAPADLLWIQGAEEPPLPDGSAPAIARRRVLVADDNPDLRRYLTRLLAPHFEVETVADGTDALAIARERPPDLLISDVMMPGLDGYELLAALRAEPATRALPVILLSARAGEEAAIEGLGAGADDYLPKPFSGRELIARARARLELADVRAQAEAERTRALEELQRSLLPRSLPEIPGIGTGISFHPGDRGLDVGGDFYDVFSLPDGNWGFVIGDVRGHGAEAAAVTALTRHTSRAIAELTPDPGRVLEVVNHALRHSDFDRFCTAVLGVLDVAADGASVRLAIAGHPLPLVRSPSGTVSEIAAHGPLLGVFDGPSFPEVTVALEPGATLVLYTDGLIERNPRVRGDAGLKALLATLPARDAPALIAELERRAFGEPPDQLPDDVAVLALQVGKRVTAEPPRSAR